LVKTIELLREGKREVRSLETKQDLDLRIEERLLFRFVERVPNVRKEKKSIFLLI
jgi:hypothetical protein